MKISKPIQLLMFSAVTLTIPIFLVFGIVRGVTLIIQVCHLMASWCAESLSAIARYFTHDNNAWIAIIVFFLGLGIMKGSWFFASQMINVHTLIKKLNNGLIKKGTR